MIDKSKLIKELSLRYNIPKVIVEAIVDSQFIFVKDTIEKGEHESIRLPYYGRWVVPPKRKEWIDSKKKDKTWREKPKKKNECSPENKEQPILGTQREGKAEVNQEEHCDKSLDTNRTDTISDGDILG